MSVAQLPFPTASDRPEQPDQTVALDGARSNGLETPVEHNEAFSFQIATDDQEKTGRYWNAIVDNGGQESACVIAQAKEPGVRQCEGRCVRAVVRPG